MGAMKNNSRGMSADTGMQQGPKQITVILAAAVFPPSFRCLLLFQSCSCELQKAIRQFWYRDGRRNKKRYTFKINVLIFYRRADDRPKKTADAKPTSSYDIV